MIRWNLFTLEIDRKMKEQAFSSILLSIMLFISISPDYIIFLSFITAIISFSTDLIRKRMSFLLKLPYRKIDIYFLDYFYGYVIGVIPMLIHMLFFGFRYESFVAFVIAYTFFYGFSAIVGVYLNIHVVILSIIYLFFDSSLSNYIPFFIYNLNIYSFIYSVMMFVLGYRAFVKDYK